MAGVRKIGANEDVISQGIEKAMTTGVEISYQAYPKETDLVLTKLSQMGEKVDAVVTYADAKTGKVASQHWNSMSVADQNLFKGSVIKNSTYQGKLVKLPNGGTVGYRTKMTNSPSTEATIDISIPGMNIDKLKFN